MERNLDDGLYYIKLTSSPKNKKSSDNVPVSNSHFF